MSQTLSLDQPAISVNYVRIIALELGLSQRELGSLLRFTPLTVSDLWQEQRLVTLRELIQIFQNSLQLTQYPDFGLRLGKRLTPTTHGAVGLLMNSSPNLDIAIQAIQHFLPTRLPFAEVQVERRSDPHNSQVCCRLNFKVEFPSEVFRVLAESCLVIFIECAEYILGAPLLKASIRFSHPEPVHSRCYTQYFHCPVLFSQSAIEIDIPEAICQIPNLSADQEIFLLAQQQCQHMLQQLNDIHQSFTTSLSAQLQKIMLSQHLKNISEDHMARMLFMSKRTLARQLDQEGTSFRIIRDTLLCQQARYYLADTALSVEAISSLLDYHDSANFRRAFKRWTGMTPQQFRARGKIKDNLKL